MKETWTAVFVPVRDRGDGTSEEPGRVMGWMFDDDGRLRTEELLADGWVFVGAMKDPEEEENR